MQITSQAVALCQEFDHPNLGIVFNGYHWYASQEGRLEQRLEAIKPWLMQVDLSGSAMSPLGWGGVATMEPVDRGELDNFAVVAALNYSAVWPPCAPSTRVYRPARTGRRLSPGPDPTLYFHEAPGPVCS